MDKFAKLLNENAILPLWPEAGQVLELRRGATYAAARSGDIRTIRIGRLLKVPTAWLRQQLGCSLLGAGFYSRGLITPDPPRRRGPYLNRSRPADRIPLSPTAGDGHAKKPSGRCKECERLTYEQLVAARRAEGLTARGRPRYSLRTHCLHGHLRSDNEVRRKTNGTPHCRICNLESMRRHRQRSRLLNSEAALAAPLTKLTRT